MSTHTDDDAAFCERIFTDNERVDEHAAYARFVARHNQSHVAVPWKPLAALAAMLLVALFVASPLGSTARGFLTIFQPKSVTPIDLSSISGAHRRVLPDLREFGTIRERGSSIEHHVGTLADASALVGFHVMTTNVLPPSIPRTVRYTVQMHRDESFTFSAAKTRASAARTHRALPAMPATLDGTTVTASIGPIVVQHWGTEHKRHPREMLVVAEAPVPTVRSSGASLQELESYLLSMPGISPDLATQIRAIGDPSTTLPIPFLATKQNAQTITIDGAPAVAIGDNTGLGAGVVWQKNGRLHAVFGTLTEDAVLGVANALR